MATPRYGGFQQGMTRLEPDPITGEMRPVQDMEEVSPNTKHEYGPIMGALAPKKTNIGVYAALAALGGDALSGIGGGAGGGGSVPGSLSSNAMSGAGFGGGASTAGFGGPMGGATFLGGAGGGAGAAAGSGAAAAGGAGAMSGGGAGLAELLGGGGGGGMGLGKMAALTGLQAGLGMLGGALEGDDPNQRQSFAGKGAFVDPVRNLDRYNRAATYMLRGLANRGPVVGLRGEASPVAGLDFGQGGPGGESLVAMLDRMLGER